MTTEFETIKKMYETLKKRNMEDATQVFKEYFKLATFWASAAQILIWIMWVLFFGQLLGPWDSVMAQMGVSIWMAPLVIALPLCQVAISSVGRITLDSSDKEQPHYGGNYSVIVLSIIVMFLTFAATSILLIRVDYHWWTLCPYVNTTLPATPPGWISMTTTAICWGYSQPSFTSLVIVAILTMLMWFAEATLVGFLLVLLIKTSRLNDVHVHKTAGEMVADLSKTNPTPKQIQGCMDRVHALYKKHGVNKKKIGMGNQTFLLEAADDLGKEPHDLYTPVHSLENDLREIAAGKGGV